MNGGLYLHIYSAGNLHLRPFYCRATCAISLAGWVCSGEQKVRAVIPGKLKLRQTVIRARTPQLAQNKSDGKMSLYEEDKTLDATEVRIWR